MSENNDFSMVPREPGALEKGAPGAKRILSSLVGDTLAHAKNKVVGKKDLSSSSLDSTVDLETLCKRGDKHYEDGEYSEAANSIRIAAERGHPGAQYWLGIQYDSDLGIVPQNHVEAVKWYRQAAEQGLADAQTSLALHYSRGEGVPLDIDEAIRWYRKAADQNDDTAMVRLSMLFNDLGDKAEAVKWLLLSGWQGKFENWLRPQITEEQLLEGEKRYHEFLSLKSRKRVMSSAEQLKSRLEQPCQTYEEVLQQLRRVTGS